jgi:hypothetical protein
LNEIKKRETKLEEYRLKRIECENELQKVVTMTVKTKLKICYWPGSKTQLSIIDGFKRDYER